MKILVYEKDKTDGFKKVCKLLQSNDITYKTAASCRGYDIIAVNHIIKVRDYIPPNYESYDYYCLNNYLGSFNLPDTKIIDLEDLICLIFKKNYITKPVSEPISNEMKDALDQLKRNWRHVGFINPYLSSINRNLLIVDVIYNDPATIVFWMDGTKTVVKADDEPYDPEKGLAMAFCKKILGNKGNYYNIFKKWLPKEGDGKDE